MLSGLYYWTKYLPPLRRLGFFFREVPKLRFATLGALSICPAASQPRRINKLDESVCRPGISVSPGDLLGVFIDCRNPGWGWVYLSYRSQGSRAARQPWADCRNRFAVQDRARFGLVRTFESVLKSHHRGLCSAALATMLGETLSPPGNCRPYDD